MLRVCFGLFADALFMGEKLGPIAAVELRNLATEKPFPRFANEFYGNWLRTQNEDALSLAFFASEVEAHPSADFSRYQQLRILTKLGHAHELRELMKDSAYDSLVDPDFRTRIGIETKDWKLIFRSILPRYFGQISLPVTLLAIVTGLFWFIIIAKLGGVSGLRDSRLFYSLVAVVLGALSTVVTAFVVEWQTHVLGLDRNGDVINDLVFFISGVGLRSSPST